MSIASHHTLTIDLHGVNPLTPTEHAAAALRAHMAVKGYTSEHLADALGLTRTAAVRRMKAKTALTIEDVNAVTRWLGIPATRLYPHLSVFTESHQLPQAA